MSHRGEEDDVWPSTCPECHAKLNPELSCRIRPCAYGRFARNLALPVLLLVLSLQVAFAIEGHSPLFGYGAGWFFFGSIMGPLIFFNAISFFFPRVRTFTCWKCGWTKDYPEKMRILSFGKGGKGKPLSQHWSRITLRKASGGDNGGVAGRDYDAARGEDGNDVWPSTCPECHAKLNSELSVKVRPGLFGRILQKIGWVALFATIILLFTVPPLICRMHQFGTHSGWLGIGVMIGPALCFYAFSLFCPKVRTFTCWECGWTRDYPEKMRILSLGRSGRIERFLKESGSAPVRKMPGVSANSGKSDDRGGLDSEKSGDGD